MASQTRTRWPCYLPPCSVSHSVDDEDNSTNSPPDVLLLVDDQCVLPHEHIDEA